MNILVHTLKTACCNLWFVIHLHIITFPHSAGWIMNTNNNYDDDYNNNNDNISPITYALPESL